MKKNNKVWQMFIGLLSLVVVLVVTQVAAPAKAATQHNGADFTTSAKVTNGPDFKHADTIDVAYELSFGSTPIKAGDTITLDFPANLRGKTPGDTFDVMATDGTVIGTAVVSDKGVVITMNGALEGKTNAKLKLNLATKYRGDEYGEQQVVFPLENNGSSTSDINLVENNAALSKKGEIQDNGTIKWTVLVNRLETDLDNLNIVDTVGDHQEMIPGVTVSNAHWTTPSRYQREKPALKEQTDYNVTYNDQGFDLKFTDTVGQLVAIDYYTKVTDPSLLTSGYEFRNNAVMTWGKGSGKPNQVEVNGKVSSVGNNSGSGSGEDQDNATNEENPDEDTGTIDVDGGTETDAEEEAREAEEQTTAKKKADKKATPAKKKATRQPTATKRTPAKGTKRAAVGSVTATQTPGKTVTKQHKLPQTQGVQNRLATIIGLSALILTAGSAVLRRYFA